MAKKLERLIVQVLEAKGATNVRLSYKARTLQIDFEMLGQSWKWNTACTPSVIPTATHICNYAKKAMLPVAKFKGVAPEAIIAAFA